MNVAAGGGRPKRPRKDAEGSDPKPQKPAKPTASASETKAPEAKQKSPKPRPSLPAVLSPKRMTALFITRGLPRLLLIIGIWAVFGAFLNYVFMPLYVRKGSADPIPDLRGSMVTVARDQAEKDDLRLVIKDERYVAGTPAGVVVDQFPAPGVNAKPGRRVQVILSTGVPTTEVPKLTGVNEDEARYRVEAAGLRVAHVGYRFSATTFDGQVMTQNPRAGTIVDRQTEVSFTVSLGREPSQFIVPEVLDTQYEQALYLIRKAGLKIGRVDWEKYVGRPQRTVMVQQPPPKTPARKGDRVDLIINGTPPETESADSTKAK